MLFQDHLRSDVFQSYDEQLADLLRTNKYVDALKLSEHVLSTTEYEQVRNLARYYQIIVQERSGQIHYLKAVQSLERLLNKEQLWFESATLYLRIQMGMANLYVEHGDFELADDLFQNLIQAKYETIELKKFESRFYITMDNNFHCKKIPCWSKNHRTRYSGESSIGRRSFLRSLLLSKGIL